MTRQSPDAETRSVATWLVRWGLSPRARCTTGFLFDGISDVHDWLAAGPLEQERDTHLRKQARFGLRPACARGSAWTLSPYTWCLRPTSWMGCVRSGPRTVLIPQASEYIQARTIRHTSVLLGNPPKLRQRSGPVHMQRTWLEGSRSDDHHYRHIQEEMCLVHAGSAPPAQQSPLP